MKVGVVSRFLPEKDGIAIYSENLVDNIKKIDVVKIGTTESNTKYKLRFDSIDLYEKINEIIKKENMDIIHFQYIAPWYGKYILNYPLIKALKKISIPKIVTLHEVQYDNQSNNIKTAILKKIEKKIVSYADKIIVHTDVQADFINNKYRTKKAECVYMGINLMKNSPKKGKNILFFGMISPGKGVKELIEEMDNLKDYNLTVAGNPVTQQYKNELTKTFKSRKNDNIKLRLGWISEEEKDELYRATNIVVLPYSWAPYQSAVLHDAIAYSIPVLVTKVGAVWEIVKKFRFGEVITNNKNRLISEGIERVYKSYGSYLSRMKKYQTISQWKNIGKIYLEKYSEVYNSKNFK